jgi:hypothetical protein
VTARATSPPGGGRRGRSRVVRSELAHRGSDYTRLQPASWAGPAAFLTRCLGATVATAGGGRGDAPPGGGAVEHRSKIIAENKPYPRSDANLVKVRSILSIYHADAPTVDKIVNSLEV